MGGAIGLAGVGYIAVDRTGQVYVADTDHGQIVQIAPQGTVLGRWGGPGDGPGKFDGVCGIAVNSIYLYASDEPNGWVHKLSITGTGLARWGGNGIVPGELNHPQGIALDAEGNVLVADTRNSRVLTLSPAGRVLRRWGGYGNEPGKFDHPTDVAVDLQGTVFVADARNARIQRLSPGGQVLGVYRQTGDGDALRCPVGVAIDDDSNLYVADSSTPPRLVKLSPWGAPVATWSLPESECAEYVQGVAVGAGGVLYVTGCGIGGQPAVIKLSATGEVLDIWH